MSTMNNENEWECVSISKVFLGLRGKCEIRKILELNYGVCLS